MSTFGDGTFKQYVYEEIKYKMGDMDMKPSEAVQEVLEVCSWILGSVDYDSEAYQQGLRDAKSKFKKELDRLTDDQ